MRFYFPASPIGRVAINGHLQVHDEIRDLQPDVIVERYLDAKYYQHPPDRVQEMSEYNSSATYLATSDQIMTLNAMETDDISMSASLETTSPIRTPC